MPAEADGAGRRGRGCGPAAAPAAAAAPAPRRPHRRLRTIGSYTLLTAAAVVVVFPIYITIVNSLLVPDQLVQQPPPLFPTNPQWHNYTAAWTTGQMSKYVATSAIMTAIIVVGQLVTSILAAYAFAFLRFPFKRTLFAICLVTLMIPLRGHLHHQPRHGHLPALVQHLRGAVHPLPRHRVRHLPAAPGLPADPARPAGGGPARRLRPSALHDPRGRAARPPVARRPGRSSRSSAPGTSTCGRSSRPAARRRSTRCRSA